MKHGVHPSIMFGISIANNNWQVSVLPTSKDYWQFFCCLEGESQDPPLTDDRLYSSNDAATAAAKAFVNRIQRHTEFTAWLQSLVDAGTLTTEDYWRIVEYAIENLHDRL